MPRPRTGPATALGVALVKKRGDRTLSNAAELSSVDLSTLSRAERGVGRISLDTALKLAAWLGWSVERVHQAAKETPASSEPAPAEQPKGLVGPGWLKAIEEE